jgi:phosphatidyl-myo-inositol dimannoside synthase
MRILMLDNEFPPLGGGTGVVNYYLLEKLSDHQHVWVDLVTSSRSQRVYEIEHFAPNITIYKVPVNNRNIHHATNLELLRYTWRGVLLSWKLHRRQAYDLSFAFAGIPAGGISYALKLLFGLPYLVSLQGPDVPGFEARYNYLYPILKPLLRRIWDNASVVTAISQQHRRLAWQTLLDLDIAIINNGVDIG